jgi:hypothetical protein
MLDLHASLGNTWAEVRVFPSPGKVVFQGTDMTPQLPIAVLILVALAALWLVVAFNRLVRERNLMRKPGAA